MLGRQRTKPFSQSSFCALKPEASNPSRRFQRFIADQPAWCVVIQGHRCPYIFGWRPGDHPVYGGQQPRVLIGQPRRQNYEFHSICLVNTHLLEVHAYSFGMSACTGMLDAHVYSMRRFMCACACPLRTNALTCVDTAFISRSPCLHPKSDLHPRSPAAARWKSGDSSET